jgi:hypothetical protein
LLLPEQQIKITQITRMFERFAALKQSQAQQFLLQLTNFIPRFSEAQKEAESKGRKNAPDFNIFRFLNYERQEEFHSRFIGYLLNPRENHEQGHLFLEEFLETLRNKKLKCKNTYLPLPEADINKGTWLVQLEVFSRDGILDIVLRNKALGTMYVIENKVDANEQADQIDRYGGYLKKYKKDYPIQGLLFLTISGYSAKTARKTTYYKMSYQNDIRDWLMMALPLVEAKTVRETVRQYLLLLQSL